jgi:hypothetical protein
MIYPPMVFLWELLSLKMPFVTKTSCFARFFVKTKGWILSLKVLPPKLLLFNPCTMIWVPSHMIAAIWSWLTMWICSSYTLMLLVYLMVLGWNSESSKLVSHCLVLAPFVLYLDLKYKLNHSSRYIVLSPPCKTCVSLKGKLFHANKENTELQ